MLTQTKTSVRSDREIIRDLKISAYTIPTGNSETDGTLEWDSTTMVLVEIEAGGRIGMGFTYADVSAALFIKKNLKQLVIGEDVMNIPAIHQKLLSAIRNAGAAGIAMMAISAIDIALWDLKAKILQVPLATLLGRTKEEVPVYGSGGFTSYTEDQLKFQLAGWVSKGISAVKMKIGRQPEKDVTRIRVARDAIGDGVKLYVDASGAYSVKQAIHLGERFQEYDVWWYEEPVSSDNLDGLRFIREKLPVNITAGGHGCNLQYFRQMLQSQSVDIVQADITRCGGVTGFMKIGHLCEAYQVPISSHGAHSLHLAVALALPNFFDMEYFHDHVRIEEMLLEGVSFPSKGLLKPDLSKPGSGLKFRHTNGEKYRL